MENRKWKIKTAVSIIPKTSAHVNKCRGFRNEVKGAKSVVIQKILKIAKKTVLGVLARAKAAIGKLLTNSV
jgi:hypothetical protein